MAPTTSIQSTHARLSSLQSPVSVTISNRISPTLANCLLGLYADKLSSNIEAAPSWHVLNGLYSIICKIWTTMALSVLSSTVGTAGPSRLRLQWVFRAPLAVDQRLGTQLRRSISIA
ncbi:hypothetical protein YC2023_013487 [Brassica napus]